METGIIDGLMDKGYGFIKREGHDKNLFFHAKELQDTEFDSLKVGDQVQFEVTEGPKGPQASNVSKA